MSSQGHVDSHNSTWSINAVFILIMGILTVFLWIHPQYWGWTVGFLVPIIGLYWLIRNQLSHSLAAKSKLDESLKDARQQLDEQNISIREMEKMAQLGQLTAGIAHEINNPVNYVSNSIQPLKLNIEDLKKLISLYRELDKANLPRQSASAIQNLEEEIDVEFLLEEVDALLLSLEEGTVRTKDIVQELKDYSRKDRNKVEALDLHQALDSTLVLLKNKIKHKVSVNREFAKEPIVIQCLASRIKQVFMNLLDNAIYALNDGGEISITTSIDHKYAKVIIRDNGTGIQASHLNQIFDRFFTTKEQGKGTGLGLFLTKQIIEEHKGTIIVDSELGKGTSFTLKLPIISEFEEALISP